MPNIAATSLTLYHSDKNLHKETVMKQRSKFYMGRKKAQKDMCHPDDLKRFLIAEYNSSQNIVVKKDIMKMIEQLDRGTTTDSTPHSTDSPTA
jgi:hypothetical protein